MSLTQDELVALVLTKLRTAGSGSSGSGSSTAQPNAGMTEEELQQFNELLAKFSTLQQVAFEQLNTNALFAELVEAGQITVDNAFANYLAALSATITNLNADKINADYISVEHLEAVVTQIQEANIDTLFADYIKTNSLIADGITASEILAACGKFFSLITTSLSAEDVAAFKISSDHVTFKSASIKNAAIESVNAGKINAGTLNTSRVAIKSGDNTSMVISDGLIQIQDNKYVRVQIGRVATNTYDMRVWDIDGQLMWSASGITAAAIKDAIIIDDMIAENANISASKIDISSLVTAINEDGNVETKASNITIDAEGQKLSAWFSTMQEWKSAQSEATSNLQTSVETINGKLSTFVSQADIQTITNDIKTIKSQYTTLNQTVDGIKSTVQSHTSSINSLTTRVETTETNYTNINQTVEGITTEVASQTETVQELSDKVEGYEDLAFVTQDTLESYMTRLEQSSNEIQMSVIQQIQNSDQSVNIETWFTFTDDGLVIGKSTTPVKLRLSPNGIDFVKEVNGNFVQVGYWDGSLFHTSDAILDMNNYILLGQHYKLRIDTDGTLAIDYV